ncbi:MAG: DUF805 domain-containing protein [Deltaproteobacteria bacterium]|jgi:uncharacterized membrane protein YhaH (DUF805 family)|nr:DUF805 domain-containing protein [Deltaproteobacteria bacterium]
MGAAVSFFKLNLFDLAVECYRLFGGRTTRRDYWMFLLAQILFNLIAALAAAFLILIPSAGPFVCRALLAALFLADLLLAFPNLVLAVRRLHDADMSGWWLLLCAVFAGCLLLALGGTRGHNRFGPQPVTNFPDLPPASGQAFGASGAFGAPPQGCGPPPQGRGLPPCFGQPGPLAPEDGP